MARTKKLSAEESHWQTVIDAANSLYKAGQYETAETKFQEAMTAAEQFGSEDPRLATTLNNLGLLHYAQKQYTEAEPLYKKAIRIREKSLGKDHPLLAMSLSNLALLYYAQKKFSKAATICKQALAIREKALDANHLDIALSLNNLALIYHGQEADKKAAPLCERALDIRENSLEPGHPLILTSMKNLLKIYKALGQKEKAKSLAQRINALEKDKGRQPTSVTSLPEDILPALEEKPPVIVPLSYSEASRTILSNPAAPAVKASLPKRRLGFTRIPPEADGHQRLRHNWGKRVWGWQQRSFTHR